MAILDGESPGVCFFRRCLRVKAQRGDDQVRDRQGGTGLGSAALAGLSSQQPTDSRGEKRGGAQDSSRSQPEAAQVLGAGVQALEDVCIQHGVEGDGSRREMWTEINKLIILYLQSAVCSLHRGLWNVGSSRVGHGGTR